VVEITPAPPEVAEALRRRQLLALRRFLEDVLGADALERSPNGDRLGDRARTGLEEETR